MSKKTRSSVFWQAAGLGMISGMRSMSAPALLSHVLHNSPSGRLAKSPLRWFQSKGAATGLKLLAGGEMVADKMPKMPDRTEPVSLVGRALSGALVGGVLYKLNRNKLLSGAVVGGLAALAGTFGAYYLRKAADDSGKVHEPWTGFIEDALVLGGGSALLRGHTPGH